MILLICLIIFICSICTLCSESDRETEREYDYNVAERRHKEVLANINTSNVASNVKKSKVTHRRILKDKDGNIIAEEIIEEV